MTDLSKLKVAIGQMEVVEGRPSANEAACDRMVDRALDAGADVLVVPNSLSDARNVRLIGLNDSRIDIAGNVVILDVCGETYRIGIDEPISDCDFSIYSDVQPFALHGPRRSSHALSVLVRPVGMRDGGKHVCAFEGASKAFGPNGEVFASLRDDFEEDFCVVSFAREAKLAPSTDKKLLKALLSTIRRFDNQVLASAPKWIIGLSGGLDSCVVAALLVLALGPDRVVGYNMATRFNSEMTKGNAAMLAATLGIPLRSGSIEDLVVSLGNTLVHYGYPVDALGGVVLENAQARARGNLLSAFAAVEGGVVVNNGNRVEGALGYATLYGDAIGALAPIGDLSKVALFDIARDINEVIGCEAIPVNLLPIETSEGYTWEMMPSAELASGQRDPMKWFYHDWLIGVLLGDESETPLPVEEAACKVMSHYHETRLLDSAVAKWVRFYGLDDPAAFIADLDWVVRSMRASAFKRIQAPPYIAISNSASQRPFDSAQVAPELSCEYNALRAQILRIENAR